MAAPQRGRVAHVSETTDTVSDDGDRRTIRKLIRFSDGEWSQVEMQMADARAFNFAKFAREQILAGRIVINLSKIDIDQVRSLISPIGNNINQIAKRVNADKNITYDQATAAQKMVDRIYDKLRDYLEDGTALAELREAIDDRIAEGHNLRSQFESANDRELFVDFLHQLRGDVTGAFDAYSRNVESHRRGKVERDSAQVDDLQPFVDAALTSVEDTPADSWEAPF